MRYIGRRQSSNIEDRRGIISRRTGIKGGIGAIVVAIVVILFGGDLESVFNVLQSGTDTEYFESSSNYQPSAHEQELSDFVGVVLADTEDVWHMLFNEMGKTYHEPKLVFFNDEIESACGFAGSASGPFYCPGDEKVYIDLLFLEQIQERLGAGGDFAVAYIIAHEIGHHVQNLLGVLDWSNSQRGKLSEKDFNKINVKVELQADFYAGVWAYHAQKMKNILESGDIEEAMNAAAAVGDDRIQKMTQGRVVPDAFTHGTSAQRQKWFNLGFRTGNISEGDTFNNQ